MIYNVSCERYFGFRCEIDEETSNKLEGLPGVLFVLPNSYVDPENKDYGRRLLLLFIWLSKAKVLTWLMSLFNQILLWLQLLTERVILLCILQHEKAVYRMNLKVGNLVCLSTVPQSRLWIEPVDRIDIWSNSRSL